MADAARAGNFTASTCGSAATRAAIGNGAGAGSDATVEGATSAGPTSSRRPAGQTNRLAAATWTTAETRSAAVRVRLKVGMGPPIVYVFLLSYSRNIKRHPG